MYAKFFRLLSSILIALSFVSLLVVGIVAVLSPGALSEFVEMFLARAHAIGVLGPVIVMTLAAVSALPAELPAIACGAMYGMIPGFFIAWMTAMFGASVAYFIGKFVRPEIIKIVFGERIFSAVKKRANEKTGVMTLFVVRLIPLFPFFIVNFASGMSGMKFLSYLLATGAGIVPGALVTTAIGAGLAFASTAVALIALSVFLVTVILLKMLWVGADQKN